MPFLKILMQRGRNVKGIQGEPPIGSAGKTKKGLLKIKAFPHAFCWAPSGVLVIERPWRGLVWRKKLGRGLFTETKQEWYQSRDLSQRTQS